MSFQRAAKLVLSLVDDVSRPAGNVVSSLDHVNQQITAMDRRMTETARAFRGAVAGFVAFGAAVAGPTRAAMAFEEALADVAKVLDPTPEQLDMLRSGLLSLSSAIAKPVEELTAIAAAAAQVGMSADEILPFTELVSKAGVAWGLTGDQAGESLAKIRSALGLTTGQTAALADALNHLANNSASSEADLVDFQRRVGAVGRQFGLTDQQTAAFGSAMIASGAQSEVAATSFRNMGRALVRGESATKRQKVAIRALGLQAGKVAADMQKDAVGTLEDVFERIRNLPREVQSSVISDIFGDEARALTPLIENTELLRHALSLVSDETEYLGSVQKEFEARSATTSNALQLLKNRARAASIEIGEAFLPRVRTLAGVLGDGADRLAAFARENRALVDDVTTVAGGLLSLRVAALAGSYGLLFIRRELLITAAAGLKLAAALRAMTIAPMLAGLAGARRALTGFAAAASISGTASAFGIAAGAIGKAAVGLLNPLRIARVAAIGLRTALLFTGVGAVIAGIAGAVTWVSNNFEGLKTMLGGIGEGFMSALGPVAPMFKPIANGVSTIIGWFEKLTGPVDASAEQWRGWGVAIGQTVGGAVRTVVESFQSVAGAISSFVTQLVALPTQIAAFGAQMYESGANMVMSLWDGAVAKFEEFIAWVRGIPSRVVSSIGKIDLSSVFSWSPFGGGAEPEPDATQLRLDGMRASLAEATSDWPAAARRAIIAYGNALAHGGAQAEAEAAAIGARIEQELEVTGHPDVDTARLERALGLARQVAAAVRGIGSGSAPVQSGSAIEGKRAYGGPVKAGLSYVVNENGDEIFTPDRNGRILSNQQSQRALAGGAQGGPTVVFHNKFVIGSGAVKGQAEELVRELDRQLNRAAQVAFGSGNAYGDA